MTAPCDVRCSYRDWEIHISEHIRAVRTFSGGTQAWLELAEGLWNRVREAAALVECGYHGRTVAQFASLWHIPDANPGEPSPERVFTPELNVEEAILRGLLPHRPKGVLS